MPQADTYRRMQKLTRGDWAGHQPATNAAWLGYLADAVLTLKATPMGPPDKRQLRAFKCARARRAADISARLTLVQAWTLFLDAVFAWQWCDI